MLYVYILRLARGKYYIGKTTDPDTRIAQHFDGVGSAWTQKYKPIEVDELIPNCDDYDEDKYTLQYMNTFGIENVRGGSFCKIVLTKANEDTIKLMNTSNNDKCYKCGKNGHFAKNCRKMKQNVSPHLCTYCNDVLVSYEDPFEPGSMQLHCTSCNKTFEVCNIFCSRCGRDGHHSSNCYARTDIHKNRLV